MKKLLMSLFVFGFLAVGIQAQAAWVSDAVLKEIVSLRANLGAAAFPGVIPTITACPSGTVWQSAVNKCVTLTSVPSVCSLSATLGDTYLSTDKTGWGFNIIINSKNKPANSKGWTTNFEGYTPSVTGYGINKKYGNFFLSSGSLSLTAIDQTDSNCKVTTTINPPTVTAPVATNSNLVISKGSASPVSGNVKVSDTSVTRDVLMLEFKLKATGSDVKIDAINLSVNKKMAKGGLSNMLSELSIKNNNTTIGTFSDFTNGATYTVSFDDSFIVKKDTTETLRVYAKILDADNFTSGDSLTISLTNATAKNINGSEARKDIVGSIIGGTQSFVKDNNGCSDGKVYSATTGQTCPVSTPSITVLSPNGGENYISGKTYDITWKSTGVDKVYIYLVKKDASDVDQLITDSSIVDSYTGKYSWTIPTINKGGLFKVVVVGKNINVRDLSDNYFTITSATTPATPAILGSKEDLISFSVKPGDTVSGILNLTGSVKNAYFNEGEVGIKLLDSNQSVLKSGFGTATTYSMTTKPVSFKASIDSTGLNGSGFILIQKNDLSGGEGSSVNSAKKILVPVIFKNSSNPVNGCLPGQNYSYLTGQKCPAVVVNGCLSGYKYNSITGSLCPVTTGNNSTIN